MLSYFVTCDSLSFLVFFFNDTATTEIYTLSLHDALPILMLTVPLAVKAVPLRATRVGSTQSNISTPRATSSTNCAGVPRPIARSEEHTSELQSQSNLVCRLLLEKKKKKNRTTITSQQHTY